jgi:hypothetical protein
MGALPKPFFMAHLLDNPVWNTLTSDNQHLAHGTAGVRHFAPDVSPFVGLQNNTPQSLSLSL